jgi:hypothetical protein
MVRVEIRACVSMALAGVTWGAGAQPVVTSVSREVVARSGRVVLRGSGFGEPGQGGYVEVGGVRAPTARWEDGSISVYVPEGAALGPAVVLVETPAGTSAAREITVEARPAGNGPIAWRFETDGGAVRHRGAVGADGTVYFSDNTGFLYAVGRDGGLRWVYCADCVNGSGGKGPVVLGNDGTVYVGGDPLGPETNIHAVNPDGTPRWVHADIWTSLVAGPGVGPDGNVYFVHENAGTGLTALSAATGEMLWSTHPTDRAFLEFGEVGAEMVFGRSAPGGELDRVYTMFDMRPIQPGVPTGAVGTLYSYDLDGAYRWEQYTGGQSIAGGQLQGQPAAGPDGTVYHCGLLPPNGWALYANRPGDGSRAWSLYLPPGNTMSAPTVAPDGTVLVVRNTVHIHAVSPAGSLRWTYTEPTGSLYKQPVASPNGEVIIAGGSVGDTLSFSAHVRAVSGAGVPLWSAYVPREPDGAGGTVGFVVTTGAFYAPDSARAYVGTAMAGQVADDHAYVLALDTGTGRRCAADLNGDGAATSQDFFEYMTAFFAGQAGADTNGDGAVDSQDFFEYMTAFFAGC